MSKKVFITSGTGYIGEEVAKSFKNKGYEVTALARTDEAAQKLQQHGFKAQRGDLRRPETFSQQLQQFDVIVHTAATNDLDFGAVDREVVQSILNNLKGSNKTFIYTSGAWVLGDTAGVVADEKTPPNPLDIVRWRLDVENDVLKAAQNAIKTIVIRPTLVYGKRRGPLEQLTQIAQNLGEAQYVGNGDNQWAIVHVEDLAEMYVLAAEKANAGEIFHASEPKSFAVRQVAEKIAQAAKVKKVSAITPEEAQRTFGFLSVAFAVNQQIDSNKARKELGWNPKTRDLDKELQAEKKTLAAVR